jgi:hypothetical protein
MIIIYNFNFPFTLIFLITRVQGEMILSISDLDGSYIPDMRVGTKLSWRESHGRREKGDDVYEPASSSVTIAESNSRSISNNMFRRNLLN